MIVMFKIFCFAIENEKNHGIFAFTSTSTEKNLFSKESHQLWCLQYMTSAKCSSLIRRLTFLQILDRRPIEDEFQRKKLEPCL